MAAVYRAPELVAGTGYCPWCGAGVVFHPHDATAICHCGARYATALTRPIERPAQRIDRWPRWVVRVATLVARSFGIVLVAAAIVYGIVAAIIAIGMLIRRRR
jgi:hypothetical protein